MGAAPFSVFSMVCPGQGFIQATLWEELCAKIAPGQPMLLHLDSFPTQLAIS